MNPYQFDIFITEDGSHSLKLKNSDESYHSHFGAVAESNCIFIDAGLKPKLLKQEHLNILEVGFGTGLNALLTLKQIKDNNSSIFYHAVEPYPLPPEIYERLNYTDLLETDKNTFYQLHRCKNHQHNEILKNFRFFFDCEKIQNIVLKDNFFDLVYFDCFNPILEPELWETNIFIKIFNAMKSGGILCTYSSKGSVRRNMKEAGFMVEKLAGPKGKREISRAVKKGLEC